jgi:hypothetical protein
LLLFVLPAAACAAAMFLCFRMMRHSDMPADWPERDDLDALRKEVSDLHQELARARSVPSHAAAADGMRQIVRRGTSETAPDSRALEPADVDGRGEHDGSSDG